MIVQCKCGKNIEVSDHMIDKLQTSSFEKLSRRNRKLNVVVAKKGSSDNIHFVLDKDKHQKTVKLKCGYCQNIVEVPYSINQQDSQQEHSLDSQQEHSLDSQQEHSLDLHSYQEYPPDSSSEIEEIEEIEGFQEIVEIVEAGKTRKSISTSESPPKHSGFSIKPGERFGRYKILSELGWGGMGVVYKAIDTQLDREVALKLFFTNQNIHGKEFQRFMQEAKATAQFEHPNIIKLFEVGHSPYPYFTMEYIQGYTLSHDIQNNRLAPLEAAKILKKIALALQVAHNKGIIHRDIKPTNIMIDYNKEPKLMDFGLAKLIHSESDLSKTGNMMGTPAYIAPEQAEGKPVDHRCDIYSLGATFYEILIGKPPFQGDSYYNVLHQVFHYEPVAPRDIYPEIPKDLEAICLKCLEKNPNKRYQTAKEMAQDLENFIEDRPIIAKTPTKITHITKFITRNKLLSSIVASFLFFVIVCLFVYISIINKERVVDQNRLADSLVAQGDVLSLVYRWQEAKEHYLKAYEIYNKSGASKLPAMQGMWNAYRYSPPALQSFFGHPFNLQCADFSRTGTLALVGSVDNTMRLWEIETGRELRSFEGHQNAILCVAFSLDEKLALSGSEDKTIFLWEIETGKKLCHFQHNNAIKSVTFSNQSTLIASGSFEEIKIWDRKTGKQLHSFTGHNHWVRSIDFSPDGTMLVSGGEDSSVKVWDVVTGSLIYSVDRHNGAVYSVCFSPNGEFIASASEDKTIRVWKVSDPQEYQIFAGHKNAVLSVNFSSNSRTLISGSEDKDVKIWDIIEKKELRCFTGHEREIIKVDISQDGRFAFSGSFDRQIKVWDMSVDREVMSFWGNKKAVNSVNFSPDGRIVLSGGEDHTVRAWDAETGKPLFVFGHERAVKEAQFSRNGLLIVAGGYDNAVSIWDLQAQEKVYSFAGHTYHVETVDFAPNNNYIIAGSFTALQLWDYDNKKLLKRFTGYPYQVFATTFSSSGTLIASGGEDETIRIWDVITQNQVFALTGHTGSITDICFSANDLQMASSSSDRSIILWDMTQRKKRFLLQGHTEIVKSITFSFNSEQLISASSDKTIRIWDVNNGRELRSLAEHKKSINSVASCQISDKILSGGEDGSVKMWNFTRPVQYLNFEKIISTARKTYNENPNDAQALLLLGNWYAFRGVSDWACKYLKKAQEYGAKQVSHLILAQCYWQMNKKVEAYQEFEKALQKNEAPEYYLRLCMNAVRNY